MTVPSAVGVVGGGRMGAGIAHAFTLAGSRVIVVERNSSSADAARERITTSLQKAVDRGVTARPAPELAGAVTCTTDLNALAECQLAIEAVFEDREVKRETLQLLERMVAATAVLATNTSSISIDDLATDLADPARFLGLHFFNPVPSSALVEIVIGSATDTALVDTARSWVRALDKADVVVRDSPGFASSRLGIALALEAIRMVEEGVAEPADIDAAMERGYRHHTGPLRTTDIVGLDVRLQIAQELCSKLGDRFEPPNLLRRMVAEGNLGRKSGRGFYEWSGK